LVADKCDKPDFNRISEGQQWWKHLLLLPNEGDIPGESLLPEISLGNLRHRRRARLPDPSDMLAQPSNDGFPV